MILYIVVEPSGLDWKPSSRVSDGSVYCFSGPEKALEYCGEGEQVVEIEFGTISPADEILGVPV